MNHIYKVIWNHAKHCYTVVSEIAKNHSTSSVTKKKVSIAAILAAGMLSGFSPMVSGAADTTNSEAVVYDQNDTSLKSTNSSSVGKNAIALGKGASAVDDSIAIGNDASVVEGGSHGKGGLALGKKAHAGYKGISLGNSAISGREGTIVIGDTTNVQSLYSTVVGTNSTITSDGTAYTLDLPFVGKKSVIVQGAVSTSFGVDNTITNKEKVFSGVANSIIGSVNTVTNSNGVTIQGTGNTVSNAYKDMNIGLGDLLNFKKGDYSSIAKQDSGAIAIIGGGNTISDQLSSTVIGFGNTLKGENSTGVFTAGSKNTLTNVSNSLVMGDNNKLTDRKNVISLGNKNTVTADGAVAIGNGTTVEAEGGVAIGESSVAKGSHSTAIGNQSNVAGDYSLAIGYNSKIIKGSSSMAIGNSSEAHDAASTAVGGYTNVSAPWGTALGTSSTVTAENGTALGGASSVTVKNGVAIGVSSKADRAAGVLGYLADTGTTEITWKANAGAVSVGTSTITRQITNVAAGTYDTDAVNVAQLKKVAGQAEKANQGWNFTTNGVAAAATNVAPGGSVDFSGDDNVSVSNKETQVKVALNKDVKLNSATFEDTVINANGLTIGGSTSGLEFSKNRVSVGGQQIHDVADGKDDMDAVNMSQLNKQAAASKTTVSDGTNTTVTSTVAKDGHTDYKVNLNKDLTGIESISNGSKGKSKIVLNEGYAGMAYGDTNVVLMNNGVYLNGKVNVDKAGQIHNVTAGTADEDAVNVSQLNKQAAASKTTVSDGTNTNVTSTVAEDGHTDYQVNLNKDLTGIESMTNGLSSIRMGNGGTVTINNRVTIDQSGKISGVAAGEVKEGSTDAVNGSQLKGVENKADKNAENIQKNTEAIAKNTEAIDKNTKDISKNAEAISKNTENIQKNSEAIAENAKNIQKNTEAIAKNTEDISKNTEAIGKLDERVTSVEEVAKKHTTVSTDDKNVQISEDTNKDGGKDYKVSLNKDLNLSSVTTGDTKMDTNGVTVKDVSLTKDGLSIGNKTYVSNEGLNANGQKVTNVAAGDISADSKDAVNGSQLFATNQQVAQNAESINKLSNRKFGADDNKTVTVKPGQTLNINGDKQNISTSVNGNNSIKVELKKDITVDSVTADSVTANSVKVGDTSISTNGLTIKDGPSITKTGIYGGNQKVTGVAAGDISADSKDAVNGGQLFATNQQVAQNAQSISKLGNRINKVGAGAAALAALHPLDFDPDDKWDFAAGYGNYNGENAAAIGAYYRPNEDTMFSVGGSFGNGENMVNAGVSLKLGQGNHVSTSKVAMAKEIKDLRKEMEGLKSALLDANAGKKLDTSKLQLFPDVPKNHWAYEYVSTLKGNGVLTGYPDGEFKGDRPMTRYEFATMLYKAMLEGATLSDRILKEFAPELERFTVDTVHQDKDGKPTVERVRTVKAAK